MQGERQYHPAIRTLIFSDVSLGYGTPQILRLANSIAANYNGEVLILEPDQPERPQAEDLNAHENIRVRRVFTASHPYKLEGSIEFALRAKKIGEAFAPDLIVGVAAFGMRCVSLMKGHPNATKVLYCLEDAGDPRVDDCVIPHVAPQWDIVIYPEKNRARQYGKELMIPATTQSIVLYNANTYQDILPASERNGRIFYGGLVHKDRTIAHHIPQLPEAPIDIFGNISGYGDDRDFFGRFTYPGGASYKGYVRADSGFFQTLARYSYSLIGWVPGRFDHFNAAPNKFFDAVACGVPPICAPHPQCVELIEKWQCGLLMDDWSFKSFKRTLEQALQIAGTDYYAEMVRNCQLAMEKELSWDRQFEKMLPLIERHVKGKAHDQRNDYQNPSHRRHRISGPPHPPGS